MTASLIVRAILIGMAYATWPIVGKFVGLSGEWLVLTVLLGTALPMLAFSLPGLQAQASPPVSMLLVLLAVSLLNGLAQAIHGKTAALASVQIGLFSMIVYVAMAVAAPLLDSVINGSHLSYRNVLAILCATAAIYLASGK